MALGFWRQDNNVLAELEGLPRSRANLSSQRSPYGLTAHFLLTAPLGFGFERYLSPVYK